MKELLAALPQLQLEDAKQRSPLFLPAHPTWHSIGIGILPPLISFCSSVLSELAPLRFINFFIILKILSYYP